MQGMRAKTGSISMRNYFVFTIDAGFSEIAPDPCVCNCLNISPLNSGFNILFLAKPRGV
jgi:hypothetical protein